jgi:hypothetical protein
MEDKRDSDLENDEIGNTNEEGIVDAADDDEFEDVDESDDLDEADATNLDS